jgi:hypothetical protein
MAILMEVILLLFRLVDAHGDGTDTCIAPAAPIAPKKDPKKMVQLRSVIFAPTEFFLTLESTQIESDTLGNQDRTRSVAACRTFSSEARNSRKLVSSCNLEGEASSFFESA